MGVPVYGRGKGGSLLDSERKGVCCGKLVLAIVVVVVIIMEHAFDNN
jgi:hypothetical protein